MAQRRLILVLALLATAAWTGAVFGQATVTWNHSAGQTPSGNISVTNGDVFSGLNAKFGPLRVDVAGVATGVPSTLSIVVDTQNVGNPSAEALTLGFVSVDGVNTFIPAANRVRFAFNLPLPGTYYFGAQLIENPGPSQVVTNAWANCTVTYTCMFHNCWGTNVDGSMNTYYGGSPGEGYAIGGAGNFRHAKSNQHYGFWGFFGIDPTPGAEGLSDNSDGSRPGHSRPGNPEDGVTMADWITGKKLLLVSLYFRMSSNNCPGATETGTGWNENTQLLGFRTANTGMLSDRDDQGAELGGGCCAGYEAPLLTAGLSGPPAWRMGLPYVDWTGSGTPLGYNLKGDAGQFEGDHVWYKVSNFDTTSPNKKGLDVVASAANTWFCSPYTPPVVVPPATAVPYPYDQGGWAGHPRGATGALLGGDGRFAFGWMIEVSNANILNSTALNIADCTSTDTQEPRDNVNQGSLEGGWFGKALDRGLAYALAVRDVSEVKALVLDGRFSPTTPGQQASIWGRDQSVGTEGQGTYGGYYYVWKATYNGDCDNDGCVDDADLVLLATAFGNSPYNLECDFNYDTNVDISDLLALAMQWTNCVPGF